MDIKVIGIGRRLKIQDTPPLKNILPNCRTAVWQCSYASELSIQSDMRTV